MKKETKELITQYYEIKNNNTTHCLVVCKSCGTESEKNISNLTRSIKNSPFKGCQQCRNTIPLPRQSTIDAIEQNYKIIQFLPDIKTEAQCKKCNNIVVKKNADFVRSLNTISKGCVHCLEEYQKSEQYRKHKKEAMAPYKEKLGSLAAQRNKERTGLLLEKTRKIIEKHYEIFQGGVLLVKCRSCGFEKKSDAGALVKAIKKGGKSNGCPRCWENYRQSEEYKKIIIDKMQNSFSVKKSAGEEDLYNWIASIIPAVSGRYFNFEGVVHQADIFIPDKRLVIEYNGMYWHSTDKKSKNYHLNKTKFFEDRNIRCIHIWDYQWENRQDQVKNYLGSVLGINQRVFARKCEIKMVDKKEASDFINKNHIQTLSKNKINEAVGLYFDGRIVAVASFGSHHRNNKGHILNRFCCESGITVVGGLSKICSFYKKKHNCVITSWADRCLSQASGYLSAGWTIEEILKPDYFYCNNKLEAIPKQKRRKSVVNTPEGKTESQHAKEDGLYRVYDCGKIRLIY